MNPFAMHVELLALPYRLLIKSQEWREHIARRIIGIEAQTPLNRVPAVANDVSLDSDEAITRISELYVAYDEAHPEPVAD